MFRKVRSESRNRFEKEEGELGFGLVSCGVSIDHLAKDVLWKDYSSFMWQASGFHSVSSLLVCLLLWCEQNILSVSSVGFSPTCLTVTVTLTTITFLCSQGDMAQFKIMMFTHICCIPTVFFMSTYSSLWNWVSHLEICRSSVGASFLSVTWLLKL